MAKGFGIASIILGIVGGIFGFIKYLTYSGIWIAMVGVVLGIVALILACIGKHGFGFAIAGIIVSIIGVVAGYIGLFIVGVIFGLIESIPGATSSSSSAALALFLPL